MDPALKQRLIGAAVLVALAVIFLPMILGRPAPAPQQGSEVPLQIPQAPPGALQTRDIPLLLPPSSASPSALPAARDPDAVVAVDADALPGRASSSDPVALTAADPAPGAHDQSTLADPTVGQAPVQPPVPAAAAADSAAERRSLSEPTASSPAVSTPAVSNPAATGSPRPPKPADVAIESAPVASGSRFAVNLGSFANQKNADLLSSRLLAAGLSVISDRIEIAGKPGARIRLGPYASRGEAEAARLAARKTQPDLTGSVIALAEHDPAPQAAPPVAAGFALQLGALRVETDAIALRDRLRRAGFAGYTERTVTDGGVLWRVRAGPELTRARADRLRDDVKAKLALDGIVVSHP